VKFYSRPILICLFWFIFCVSLSALAAIPKKIHYQGKITTALGGPISRDTYKLTLRLYETQDADTPVWTEEHNVEVGSDGIFNLYLGDNTSLSTLDFSKEYWLGIEVNSDGEMSPRIPLLSVGYSLNTETLDAIDSSQFLRSDVADTMEAPLTLESGMTVQGATTMQGQLVFSGVDSDITAADGEDITIAPQGDGNVVVNLNSSSAHFAVATSGSSTAFQVNDDGGVIVPMSLLVGSGSPSSISMSNAGSLYVAGDLEVSGSLIYGSSAAGGNAMIITDDNEEAFLVRKDSDQGDVFLVDTINSNVEVRSGVANSTNALVFSHDNTDGHVATSTGNLFLTPATGALTVVGTGSPSNISSANSNLFVAGQLETGSNAYIGGPLSVSGALNAASTLTVTGATILSSTLSVSGAISASGLITAMSGLSVSASSGTALSVSQTGSGNALSITGGLTRIGATGSPSYADGAGDIYVQGDLETGGTIYGTLEGSIDLNFTQGSIPFANSGGSLIQDNSNLYWDDANDRLGIGTNSPGYALDVAGQIQVVGGNSITDQLLLRETASGGYVYAGYDNTNSYGRIGAGIYSGSFTPALLYLQPSGGNLRVGQNSELFVNTSTHRVGINTNSPQGALDVQDGDLLIESNRHIVFDSDDSDETALDTYMYHDDTNDSLKIVVDGLLVAEAVRK